MTLKSTSVVVPGAARCQDSDCTWKLRVFEACAQPIPQVWREPVAIELRFGLTDATLRTTALSNLDPACFAEPQRFDPDRFAAPREEDAKHPFAYVPFGGGRHRCLGANFALMQQKAIFSVLLRRFEFELVAPPRSYVDNYSAMVVRPKQPFLVRYRRRS